MIGRSRALSRTGLVLLAMVTVAGCSPAPAQDSRGADGPAPLTSGAGTRTPAPQASVATVGEPRALTENLEVPWAIAFLPGGDALVTERDSARLMRVTPQGGKSEVGVIEGVSPNGEGGLLGVAVSPKFSTDHFIFVYFTADSDNRIVRYRYDNGLSDPTPIVTGIPNASFHNGGRLEFGPDGYLYVATGETGDEDLAQDKSSLGGKILRMAMDGKPAPGNPFDNLVYSYGHRHVQGLAWDRQGHMYATEFGQNAYDEVNLIEKGHNYGWPEVEGMGGGDEFTDPLLTWTTDEASPSGLAYADGSLWMAALRGQRLWQIPLRQDGSAGRPIGHFTGKYGRLRAVTTAPGGTLWVSTSNRDGRGSPRQGDDRILLVTPR
jgi:glucose/arabinose dehydrogenase